MYRCEVFFKMREIKFKAWDKKHKMKKYKITGEIEADNEEDARFNATIEGGNGILEFEEIIEIGSEEKVLRDKLLELIKSSEADGGIMIEEIQAKIKTPLELGFEIDQLLEDGIIFEPRPHKLRWLG